MKKDMTQDAKSLIEKSALAADYLRRTAVLVGELRGLAAECDPEAADLPAEELPPVLRAGIADIRTGLDELRTELDTVAGRFAELMADPTLSIEGEAIDIYGDRCKDDTYSRSPLTPLDRTAPIVTNACGDESYEVPTVAFLDASMEVVDSCWDSEPGEKTIRTDNVATAAVYFVVNNWSEIEPGPVWYRHGGATLARREAATTAAITRSIEALRETCDDLTCRLDSEYISYDSYNYDYNIISRYIELIHGDNLAYMDDYAFQIKESWDPATTSMLDMFAGDSKLRYFPAVDTSAVTDMHAAFSGSSITHMPSRLDTSKVTSFGYTFYQCTYLTTLPVLDTSSATTFREMFHWCSSLKALPPLDSSKVTSFWYAFSGCSSLTEFPPLDTSSAINMQGTFFTCSQVTKFPPFDTSSATDMSHTFRDCLALTELGGINTSKATTLEAIFYGCRKLKAIPALDTSRAKSIRYLVRDCRAITELQPIDAPLATDCEGLAMGCLALRSVGALNIPEATNLSYLFDSCSMLREIPAVTTAKATTLRRMFYDCRALTRAPEIDAASATDMTDIIRGCSFLTHLTIRNLGQAPGLTTASLTGAPTWGKVSDEARQTLVDTLLTYSFDRAAAGYDVCRISVASAVLARLTEAEIAAITAKGFTITA